MNDLISRKAAIDAICKVCTIEEDYHKCNGYPETSTWCDELVALRALPSAHPINTIEELKAEADKLGYRIVKKPDYDCSCYSTYPNESCKFKNGKWACIDKYRPIEKKRRSEYSPVTYCERIKK